MAVYAASTMPSSRTYRQISNVSTTRINHISWPAPALQHRPQRDSSLTRPSPMRRVSTFLNELRSLHPSAGSASSCSWMVDYVLCVQDRDDPREHRAEQIRNSCGGRYLPVEVTAVDFDGKGMRLGLLMRTHLHSNSLVNETNLALLNLKFSVVFTSCRSRGTESASWLGMWIWSFSKRGRWCDHFDK